MWRRRGLTCCAQPDGGVVQSTQGGLSRKVETRHESVSQTTKIQSRCPSRGLAATSAVACRLVAGIEGGAGESQSSDFGGLGVGSVIHDPLRDILRDKKCAKRSNSWFRSRDFRVSRRYEPCTLPLRQVAMLGTGIHV